MTRNYETPDGWDMDREEADMQQAELEAAGRDYDRSRRKMLSLRESDPMAAAKACRHGSGYPLSSGAARNANDPRAGQDGFRCTSCGSALASDPFVRGPVRIVAPCELEAV